MTRPRRAVRGPEPAANVSAEQMDVDNESVDQQTQPDDDYQPDQSTGSTMDDMSSEATDDTVNETGRRGRGGRGGGGRQAAAGARGAGGRNAAAAQANRRPAQKAANADHGDVIPDDDNVLFNQVRQGKAALQSVIEEWIESYRQDRESASLELMQFFIRSSGCKGKITPVMRETQDNAQIIRQFVDEFDEDAGGDYPLIQTGPMWKKFRSSFCEFVNTLVRQCQYSIIYDQYLMESVISLLITLSDSQVRAFRHTATLAAMKLMTALVDVALTLSINLDNTQRQYESERMKSKDKRASDRLDSLMSKRQELEENMEDIRTMLGYLFKSIFVHRYRDSVAEIRATCMAEIGTWMKRFPNHFLDDSYLKYVGWTLHDKSGDVRSKCLQALLPLYESEEIARKMELFTNKFKDRIVAMTLDKEYDVAVQAVRLICSIHKYHPDLLSDKDCEHVYELVYTTHRHVAQAAGEFLNERLFQVDTSYTTRSRRGKKRSVHTPLIRDLIQFFIESELHQHAAYLVDSLIDSHPMMKDWECMTDLILEEPGTNEEVLDDQQESSLIEIMVCCVRQAASGEPPIGRGPNRKQVSAKEAKQIQDDKNRISEHFIQTLPALLDKYKTDNEKIANLVTIPQCFELSYFTQNQDSLDNLLRLLNQIVEIHSDTDVLEGAAKSYEYLHDDSFTFSRNVWLSRSNLFDNLTAKYREATERYVAATGGEEEITVTTMIKKIAVFYACHDLTQWSLWDDLFERWIKSANQDPEDVPVEAVKHAICATHMGLIWDLHLLSEARNSGSNAMTVKQKVHDYMNQMKTAMVRHQNEVLEEEAFLTICDLLIVFSHQLEHESPAVAPLVYKPDATLVQLLQRFVLNRVFVEESEEEEQEAQDGRQSEKIERLHKRRHFLSAYCKLIVYNILPVRQAACVIKNYVRFYSNFGDIIKTTLGKSREINKVICAKTMATALIEVFSELRDESSLNPNAFTKQDENFQALKELAKRFALSFGLDNHKNRDAVAALHREGIQFTFNVVENPINPLGQPPNLPFLEILSEFSNKLIRQDKKTVLGYLDKYVKSQLPGIHNDEWQALMSYRSSLMQHNEFDIPASRAPGRHYSKGRKRGQEFDEEDGEQEDNESEMGSEMAEG